MVFLIGGPGGNSSEVYVKEQGEDHLENSDDVIHVGISVKEGAWSCEVC